MDYVSNYMSIRKGQYRHGEEESWYPKSLEGKHGITSHETTLEAVQSDDLSTGIHEYMLAQTIRAMCWPKKTIIVEEIVQCLE